MNNNIGDDVWFEIFLRLPLAEILRFKCVSKVWLSILSNPHFINKWYKINSSLWTLILGVGSAIQNPISRFNSGSFTLSCPELDSQFISHHQSVSGFSFRFLNQKHELKNKNLYIVGSSNGLVLCSTSLYNQKIYYVCNPLTKKWVSLPPPPTVEFFIVTGLTCESSLSSTSFKVFRVSEEEDAYKIDIFTSDLGKWNVYNVLCPPDVYYGHSVYDNYVTHNGVLYWMRKVKNDILAFSIDINNYHETCGNMCELMNLPDRQNDNEHVHITLDKTDFHQCLGESEGSICFAILKDTEKSLSVWVLEDNWFLLHKDIKFCDMLAQMESSLIEVDFIKDVQVLGFSPVDKNVVIIRYKKHILAYNIRNGVVEQLSHPFISGRDLSGILSDSLSFVLKPMPTILPPVSW